MDNNTKNLIEDLKSSNEKYVIENQKNLKKYIDGQKPKIAILTCSDSRVIPEAIFNKSIGDLFVVRVAGNVAMDNSVLSSLEYAVDHLKVDLIIILGHTNCGAVCATESTNDTSNLLLNEIRQSFSLDENHFLSNILYQLANLPKRSKIISNAIDKKTLNLVGAIYHLEDGKVEFL